MTALEKFEGIVGWYARNSSKSVRCLRPQSDMARIARIEALLGEALPADITDLFRRYDGDERSEGMGSFLGHGLVNLDNAVRSLEFSESLIKPSNPVVDDVESANAIISEMIAIHVRALGLRRPFARSWHKLEFKCGPAIYGGPYLYRSASTSETERAIPAMSSASTDEIMTLAGRLHERERSGYNWDELHVTAFADGRRTVERTFYNFDDIERRIFPQDAIREKYFHIKWCPVIEDHGGNYIGVDLDPGPSGIKGQVIVFGRDEDDMYVLAQSWELFLDLLLAKIESGGEELLGDAHLHDLLRPAPWRT